MKYKQQFVKTLEATTKKGTQFVPYSMLLLLAQWRCNKNGADFECSRQRTNKNTLGTVQRKNITLKLETYFIILVSDGNRTRNFFRWFFYFPEKNNAVIGLLSRHFSLEKLPHHICNKASKLLSTKLNPYDIHIATCYTKTFRLHFSTNFSKS